MFIRWKYVIAAAIAAPFIGLFVAWSGVFGIGASSGHWAITDWFLHWSMRNSTRTAALGTEVPPLDNPEMLPLGAGHYAQACAMCHGSPAQGRPAVVFGMLPVPPDLKDDIPTWTDAELFQIVQHGVRFTGMPAWPVQTRPDEVWAMVAFLRAMPSMDAERYRQLSGVHADNGGADDGRLTCASCHDENRLNGRSLIPSLAGQSEAYLRESLIAYAQGNRASGVMATAIHGMDATETGEFAAYFAQQPRRPAVPEEGNPRGADIAAGRVLAMTGRPEDRIPACLSCHEKPDGNPLYPSLVGQSVPYLSRQLHLFREGERGGTRFSHLMARAAHELTDADIENLSAYFASGMPQQ
ncbi:c-type cytochrome [Rhizobium sp. SSA_523]|uniref:c-type cytochrome n=1 Tax=Rhizobium sp. SSA_523 TaxID=2952477 RepID=UPI00209046D0|nr:c-type cytochrome [Rhizobium sp. SSA_523]MCO5731729.1 c-type cytochrome [Rhizobium sp. SSA_523]WKC22898.1 c-type cytochrome [Rhizobium sp. SSA_523]